MNILTTLKNQFSHLNFITNESLAKHTPVGIGGPAEIFWQAETTKDLLSVLRFCQQEKIPVTIIGWGANTLFADRGLTGLVIKNNVREIEIHPQIENEKEKPAASALNRWQPLVAQPATATQNQVPIDSQYQLVTLSAGAPLPWVINQLLAKNLVGLEHFAKIPATVGGAIYNNIHGGQYFFGQFLTQVEILNPQGQTEALSPNDLELDYDYSRFHHSQEFILTATLKLHLGDGKQALEFLKETAKNKAHQPAKSLGCVWQNLDSTQKQTLNLPTTSVGYLIDQKLHLSGLKIGGAQVSLKHAAFIENVGQATASDYLAVMKKITQEASDQLGVKLHPEIFFKGFSQAELAGLNLKRDNR